MNLQLGFILIIAIAGCECASKSGTYRKEPAFAEQMCHADQVNFTAVTPNAVSCARKCGETPGCESLIYLPGNNTCFGIKADNPFNVSTPLPGAEFYKPISAHVTTSSTTASSTSSTPTSSQTTPTTTAAQPPTTTTTQPTTTTTTQPTTTTTTQPTTTTTQPTTTTTQPTTTTAQPTTTTTQPTTTTTQPTTTTTQPTTTTTQPTTTTAQPTTTTTQPTTTTTQPTTTTTQPTTTTTQPTTTTPPLPPTTTTTTTTAASTTTTYGPETPLTAGLPASQFSASTTHNADYGPDKAKLSNTASSWSASTGNHNNLQWIQVDFGSQVLATTVITTGEAVYAYWVSSYKVLTSNATDCTALVTVQDGLGNDMVFPGNVDHNTEVANTLDPPVPCRCLRIKVESFVSYVAMRFEVLGHWL